MCIQAVAAFITAFVCVAAGVIILDLGEPGIGGAFILGGVVAAIVGVAFVVRG